MVICDRCHLAQLEEDDTSTAEPRGIEPIALVRQAEAAVDDLVRAGVARVGGTVAEFGSPHGGSWLGLLVERGLLAESGSRPVDLVVDSFGLMHEPDQRSAVAARAARVRPGGVLAVQFHSLASIVQGKNWNALRHGHFAYYSTPVLVAMAEAAGLRPIGWFKYDLYGGTVVLLFRRGQGDINNIGELIRDEIESGVIDSCVLTDIGRAVAGTAAALRGYMDNLREATVVGYGAASRAVALLQIAAVTAQDCPFIADASPAKQGRSMPGNRIPIVSPEILADANPNRVLLFVPDLLDEVRTAMPGVERFGGRWTTLEPRPREIAPVCLAVSKSDIDSPRPGRPW